MRFSLLVAIALTLITSNARAQGSQFSSDARTALQDCTAEAVKDSSFRKTTIAYSTPGVDKTPPESSRLVFECDGGGATKIYALLGQWGIDATPLNFTDHSRGLYRQFGESRCYQFLQYPDGSPRSGVFCRIVLNVGTLFLERF